MNAGLELLEQLCDLEVDLLFTTRALFTTDALRRLDSIRRRLAASGHLLFGCVSVAQIEHPLLEPHPIAAPRERLVQLGKLKELGLVSVLTIRPFLPVVPIAEYISIITLAAGAMDAVLGSVWYTDKEGVIRRQVLGGYDDKKVLTNFRPEMINFDENDDVWLVYEGKPIEDRLRQHCDAKSLPFFMHSSGLIEWARANR